LLAGSHQSFTQVVGLYMAVDRFFNGIISGCCCMKDQLIKASRRKNGGGTEA